MLTPRIVTGGLDAFLVVFSAVTLWLTPGFTRRDLMFGITVAPNARATNAGHRIIRGYRLGVTTIGVVALLVLGLALALGPASWWQSGMSTVAVVLIFAAYLVPYLLAYRASRALRAAAPPAAGEAAIHEAELRPRHYAEHIPLAWEILPISLIVATAVYLATLYSAAPAIIPTHFDAAGVPNAFASKSVGSFFGLVWTQIGLYVVLTGACLLIVRAKSSPGAASYRFQRVTLQYLFLFKSLLLLVLGAVAALVSRAAVAGSQLPSWLMLAVLVPVLLLTVASLGIALRIGQGGAKLENTPATQIDRMDDRYWWLGLFYVNRADPSILVQRRFGYGWTLNLGNVWAVVTLLFLIGIPVGLAVARALARGL